MKAERSINLTRRLQMAIPLLGLWLCAGSVSAMQSEMSWDSTPEKPISVGTYFGTDIDTGDGYAPSMGLTAGYRPWRFIGAEGYFGTTGGIDAPSFNRAGLELKYYVWNWDWLQVGVRYGFHFYDQKEAESWGPSINIEAPIVPRGSGVGLAVGLRTAFLFEETTRRELAMGLKFLF